MSLTESIVLAEISMLPEANAINVRWDRIIKDGDNIISRVPHRKAYGVDQRTEFLAEVEGAAQYAAAIGWGA